MEHKPQIIIACMPIDPSDADAFRRATSRLDSALNRLPAQRRACLQDGNDLTFFDHDSLRVGLSWVHLDNKAFLILALGAHPDIVPFDPQESINDVFAKALIKMIAPTAETDLILWQSAQGALVSDILDDVADTLEHETPQVIRPAATPQTPLIAGPVANTNTGFHAKAPASHRRGPVDQDDVLADLRAVIGEGGEPSMQMKLSAYALSTAFVFVTPAVGLAMLTYAVLRHGEDLIAA